MRWLLVPSLKHFVLLAAAASLLLNVALLMPSLYMLQVFDRVFASRSIETLVMLSALTVLALAFAYCMDVARSRALSGAGATLDRLLSPAALAQALHQAAAGHGRAHVDRLRDVSRLRSFLGSSGVHALFDAPWLPVYVLVIGLMHPLLGVASALAAAALAVLAVVTERLTRDSADTLLQRSRSASHHAESLTRHAEVVVGMGMGAHAIDTWRAKHQRLLDTQAHGSVVAARLAALARIARQGVQMALLGLGAWLVIGADASPGIMVAATVLLGRALQPVEHLIGGWKQLVDARSAWRRLSEPQPHAAAHERLRLPAPTGRLQVERLVFAHEPPGRSQGEYRSASARRLPNEPALPPEGLAPEGAARRLPNDHRAKPALIKNISFDVDAGESLGIVGASGSGKTTLVRLLLGIWHGHSGAVRLDGANIAHWDRDDLGAHVGYLPQDVSLFAGTIAQNIARLGPVDDERVVEAARLAHAHDMILRLPDGYDTVVGDAGAGLSGGQRQRIALARALYGQPKLVVLDEPNSNLDAEGDQALKAALQALKARGATVVVVGHRPALMAGLDKLAVLKDGALEAFGPAAAVLARLQGAKAHSVHPLPAKTTDIKEAVA